MKKQHWNMNNGIFTIQIHNITTLYWLSWNDFEKEFQKGLYYCDLKNGEFVFFFLSFFYMEFRKTIQGKSLETGTEVEPEKKCGLMASSVPMASSACFWYFLESSTRDDTKHRKY